jgi:hypothetical protein
MPKLARGGPPPRPSELGPLLRDELVLRAAWLRVEGWYASAEWAPVPELAAFRLHLHERLRGIGQRLADNTFAPSRFRLVPYPKHGDHLRHYCVPSVEDQVAFAVFGVLLGPIIDTATPAYAFGNRVWRGMSRKTSSEGGYWSSLPYTLDGPSFYLPYRRDYGLFRRVAAWTAAAIVRGETSVAAGAPSDFATEAIPQFTRAAHWPAGATGYWARTDLRLAYPTVDVKRLGGKLIAIAKRAETSPYQSGFPQRIAERAWDERASLAARLGDLLMEITYTGDAIDSKTYPTRGGLLPWSSSEWPGLPTGLAISGMLFNVAMSAIDAAMSHPDSQSDPWAFVRFADDMVLLSASRPGLEHGAAKLSAAVLAEGFEFNEGKIQPEAARGLFAVSRPDDAAPEGAAGTPASDPPKMVTFDARSLRPFVTYMIERLSVLGGDEPRFGTLAAHYLVQLHQLAQYDLPSLDVRADTRQAFAANRLSRAFLPVETGSDSRDALRAIRTSVAHCRRESPQKVTIWRAVVRAAARRPMAEPNADVEAEDWLVSLLREIAALAPADDGSPTKAQLENSFHRAVFWRELAQALDDLARVGRGQAWPAAAWTFRAVDEAGASAVRVWLGKLDKWVHALYAQGSPSPDWWWELDGLALARLACTSLSDILPGGFDEAGGPSLPIGILSIPLRRSGKSNSPVADKHLKHANRVVEMASWRRAPADWRIMTASLAGRHAELVEEHEASLRRHFAAWSAHAPSAALVGAHVAGLAGALPSDFPLMELPAAPSILDLDVAAMDRGRAMERWRGAEAPRRMTLLEALWATPSENRVEVRPAQASAFGLPVRIGIRLLDNALRKEAALTARPEAGDEGELGIAWELKRGQAICIRRLRAAWGTSDVPGRLPQLKAREDLAAISRFVDSPIELHPAFRLPRALGAAPGGAAERLLGHILQFFLAVTGGERFLDRLVDRWISPRALAERWELRRQVALPTMVWGALDELLRACLRGDDVQATAAADLLAAELAPYSVAAAATDFQWDRVDVALWLDGTRNDGLDIPMGSGRLPGPPIIASDPSTLVPTMTARVGQVANCVDWVAYAKRFSPLRGPREVPRAERQAILGQVTEAFEATASGHGTDLLLLPEVAVPKEELPEVRKLVRRSGRTVLAGLTWRAVPLVRRGGPVLRAYRHPWTRLLVNEAVLIAPVAAPSDPKHVVFREFTIRKPVPTYAEHALCKVVSAGKKPEWRMLSGRSWYRFVHERWGDFTVAICSDLSDPRPWSSFEGQVLHLFMVSCNEDIDLFEQLTWTRAFELHANVVAVNHGSIGGSFVWTPQHRHHKEIARLRGPELMLLADVKLLVKALAEHQQNGAEDAVVKAEQVWRKAHTTKVDFKAPRPGFRARK